MKKLSIVFLLILSLTIIPMLLSTRTPTVLAQTPQNTSPSVVWRQFPYIPPHLVQNSTHYAYVTDWGN